MRGATASLALAARASSHFNPRAPCGARPGGMLTSSTVGIFQSTRPMRGATQSWQLCCLAGSNFNPRAPCGARRAPTSRRSSRRLNFNPRAPCGARHTGIAGFDAESIFQSTRPMRGATSSLYQQDWWREYFNPRAPCGARLFSNDKAIMGFAFQSTRPMRGATTKTKCRRRG